MYSSHRTLSAVLSLGLCVATFGCSLLEDKNKLPPGANAENEVGRPLQDHELSVSLRIHDSAPTGAGQVEATDEQLRLDGEPVVALARGRVADADKADGIIPKLEARLRAPARSTLALRLQANLPYETTALVMNTARKAGVSNVAFQVRETGAGKRSGWLNIDGFVMTSRADDLPPIQSVKAKSWNDFTDNWTPVFDGCRTARTGNCAYVNENVAEGGTLRLELMASGRGININFFRRGLSPEQEADEEELRERMMAVKKEDFLQGRITHDDLVEAILLGDPSTYALFQFRYQEALKGPSALGKTMAPICQKERCGVAVMADNITPMLNILSMIGAAFPDGTPPPAFAFVLPWTERPKPASLAEFIEKQQKQM